MCGDFVCAEISKDENFYDGTVLDSDRPWLNRYNFGNPLGEFGIHLKTSYVFDRIQGISISQETKDAIDAKFSEKNLILNSHYFRYIPLPRVKRCQVYSSEYWVPFYYTMVILKGFTSKIYLVGGSDTTGTFERLVDYYKDSPTVQQVLDNIKERGWYYKGEIHNLNFSLTQSKKKLKDNYERYRMIATVKIPDHRPGIDFSLNIDELMTDPENNVAKWAELFDMAAPLNIGTIKNYHSKNLLLIENQFSKPYDQWVEGNWLDDLTVKVKEMCPDALPTLDFE